MFGTKRKFEEIENNNVMSVKPKKTKTSKKTSSKKTPSKKTPSKKTSSKKNSPKKPTKKDTPKKDDKKKPSRKKTDIPKFFFLDLMFNDPKSGRHKEDTPKLPELPVILECNNPVCDHKTFEEEPELGNYFNVNIEEINTIDDLIYLGKKYHCKKQTTFRGLNMRLMCNLVTPLTELNNMVGLSSVKQRMAEQILFFLQGFNSSSKCNNCIDCSFNLPCIQTNSEMMHTVITGPPGVGKTCLARIIGKVYKAMGILSNGHFKEATRNDFVDKYLGHTADKTQKFIDSCMGGVLFIDEAYSLGHKEHRDSFAKEALDTLNKNLSDKRDLLCIIAGYEKDLEECFFSANDGLRRRFTFKYVVEGYDSVELKEMFELKVKQENWTLEIEDDDLLMFFRNNKEKFPYYGGDIETLFLQCKISHGKRMPENKKCLTFQDVSNGFDVFVSNRKHKKVGKNKDDDPIPGMYVY
jgi:hypothetical protein